MGVCPPAPGWAKAEAAKRAAKHSALSKRTLLGMVAVRQSIELLPWSRDVCGSSPRGGLSKRQRVLGVHLARHAGGPLPLGDALDEVS